MGRRGGWPAWLLRNLCSLFLLSPATALRKTILPASGTMQAGEDTLNREYHLLSSHPCKQAALKRTNRGLGGHMPSERALFSLFVFLPFCVMTILGMRSEVSEISCLQKENLKV